MDMYWHQQEVFLMGILSLFPEKIKDRALTLDYDWYYLNAKTEEEMARNLHKLKKAGYIQYHEVPIMVSYAGKEPDPDDEINFRPAPRGYVVSRVDMQKVTDALTTYLENWRANKLLTNKAHKPDDYQFQHTRLLEALTEASKNQSTPLINGSDVFGNPENTYYDHQPPFWEVVLEPHLVSSRYKIREMNYDLDDRGQPFVSIELNDPMFRRDIELMSKSSEPIDEEELEEYSYKGLLAQRDGTISYNGTRIPFTPQECDVMRVFLRRPEELRPYDSFTDPLANIFGNKKYADQHATLSKLISATRRKLKEVTKQNTITNEAKRGWVLNLQ